MDYALQVEPLPYDPQKAKQLLAEAGYPNGFDAGELVPIPPFFTLAEAVVNYLERGGHPGEDAARWSARPSTPPGGRRSCAGSFITAVGNSGNAASRV